MGRDSEDEVATYMRGFNLDEAIESLSNCGLYCCAVPAPAFDECILRGFVDSRVQAVINDNALTLQSWPTQKVAIRTGEDLSKKDFTVISPEEIRIGQIGNIARRKLWCIPVEFRIMDSEHDRWLTAVSLRREMRVVSPQRQPDYREQQVGQEKQVGQPQRQDVRQ